MQLSVFWTAHAAMSPQTTEAHHTVTLALMRHSQTELTDFGAPIATRVHVADSLRRRTGRRQLAGSRHCIRNIIVPARAVVNEARPLRPVRRSSPISCAINRG